MGQFVPTEFEIDTSRLNKEQQETLIPREFEIDTERLGTVPTEFEIDFDRINPDDLTIKQRDTLITEFNQNIGTLDKNEIIPEKNIKPISEAEKQQALKEKAYQLWDAIRTQKVEDDTTKPETAKFHARDVDLIDSSMSLSDAAQALKDAGLAVAGGMALNFGRYKASLDKLLGRDKALKKDLEKLQYIQETLDKKGVGAIGTVSEFLLDPVNVIPIANFAKKSKFIGQIANALVDFSVGAGATLAQNYGVVDDKEELKKNVLLAGGVATTLGALVRWFDMPKDLKEDIKKVKNKIDNGVQVSEKEAEYIDNAIIKGLEEGKVKPKTKEAQEIVKTIQETPETTQKPQFQGIDIQNTIPTEFKVAQDLTEIPIKTSDDYLKNYLQNNLEDIDEYTFKSNSFKEEIKDINKAISENEIQVPDKIKFTTLYTPKDLGMSIAGGSLLGFKRDENGNWTWDPERAMHYTLALGFHLLARNYSAPYVKKTFNYIRNKVDENGIIRTALDTIQNLQQKGLKRNYKTFNPQYAIGEDFYLSNKKRMGRVELLEQKLLELVKPLSKLNRTMQTFAYDYLTDRAGRTDLKGIIEYYKKYFNVDYVEPEVIETALKPIAQSKKMIRVLGKYAVKEGLMPKESFERFQNKYLPRIYLAYVIDEGNRVIQQVGNDRIKLYGWKHRKMDLEEALEKLNKMQYPDQFKEFGEKYLKLYDETSGKKDYRTLAKEFQEYLGDLNNTIDKDLKVKFIKDLKELERGTLAEDTRKLLGEIKRADYLVYEAIRKLGINIINKKFLNSIAENPAYVLDDKIVEITQDAVGRQRINLNDVRATLKELNERGMLAELYGNNQKAAQRIYQEVDKRLTWLEQNDFDINEPFEYVKLNGKVFGDLDGKYVRKDIYDFLKTVYTFELNPDEFIKRINSIARKYTNFWKKKNTAYNLPTHGRNLLSNFQINAMDGYDISTQIWDFIKLVKTGELKKWWKLAEENGLINTTFAANELRMLKDEVRRIAKMNMSDLLKSQEFLITLLNFPIKIAGKTANKLTDLYQKEDAIFRVLRLYHEMVRNKKPLEEAVVTTAKNLLDYSDVINAVEYARSNPYAVTAMPFVTFSYKMMGKIGEKLLTDPYKVISPIITLYFLQQGLLNSTGLTYEDLKKYVKALPDYIERKAGSIFPSVLFVPNNGKMYAVDIGYILPQTQFFQMINNLTKGDVSGTLKDLGVSGMPLVNLMYGLIFHTDPFTGRDLYENIFEGEDRENIKKMWEYGKWALQQLFPPMLNTDYGAFKHLYNYLSQTPNLYGETEGMEVLPRLIGINIYKTGKDSDVIYRNVEEQNKLEKNQRKFYIQMLKAAQIKDKEKRLKEQQKIKENFKSAILNQVRDLQDLGEGYEILRRLDETNK